MEVEGADEQGRAAFAEIGGYGGEAIAQTGPRVRDYAAAEGADFAPALVCDGFLIICAGEIENIEACAEAAVPAGSGKTFAPLA